MDEYFASQDQRERRQSGESAMHIGSETSDDFIMSSPPTSRPSSSQGLREEPRPSSASSDREREESQESQGSQEIGKHLGRGCKQADFDEVNMSLRPYQKFFKLHKIEDPRPKLGHPGKTIFSCLAICNICSTGGVKKTYVKFTSESRDNLRVHLKGRGHGPKVLHEYDEIKAATSKKGQKVGTKDTKHQLTFKQAQEMSKKFTQERGRQAWVKWLTSLCLAPSISSHPATRQLMDIFRPEFQLPSHTAITNTVEDQAKNIKKELIFVLKEVSYVATTADSWSAHHRAFLGCTVHWIDAKTLSRKHGTLACKELKDKQTKELLATELYKINSEFGITRKIAATTTDNGASYCAAYDYYGGNPADPPFLAPEHQDPDGGGVDIVDVYALLTEEEEVEDLSQLPIQRRCAAHTLNLLATSDVSKVVGWNHGSATGRQGRQPFTKAAAKAQALWNLHNRSSVVANRIKEVLGRKLKTPCPTR